MSEKTTKGQQLNKMRATTRNLVIAQGNELAQIDWSTTPIVDAPKNFPVTLSITKQNLALGRADIQACAIAQACKERDYAHFAIGVDTARVGAFWKGKPVRLRYRSGNLPKKFDAAVAKLEKTGVFDVRHLETDKYLLRPPTESQSLEYKKARSKEDKTKEPKQKRLYNRKPKVEEFKGRGRLG